MIRALSIRLLGIGAVALWLGGCASTLPYPDGGQERGVTIVVDNSRTSFSSMTVHLLAPDGTRIRLGQVGLSDDKKTFTVNRPNLSGTYRLSADPLGRSPVTSHTFPLGRGDVVEWDLRQNFVQRVGRVSGD